MRCGLNELGLTDDLGALSASHLRSSGSRRDHCGV